MSYLKIFGFLFSLTGYFSFFYKKVNSHFIPLLTFSLLADIVFIGGIFHQLYPISLILYFLGIFLLILTLITQKKISFTHFLTLGNVAFLIGSLAFLILLLHTHFIHYDNFSHWGIVVKEMLITNAFQPVKVHSSILPTIL